MKYVCTICGYIYDEEQENTKFRDLPDDWTCPLCGAPKSAFEPLEEKVETKDVETTKGKEEKNIEDNMEEEFDDDMQQLSIGQLSMLCSNLARGCQKQYKFEEEKYFKEIAKYLEEETPKEEKNNLDTLLDMINLDINELYPNTNKVADMNKDRGAKRANTWGEKVTRISNSLLNMYKKQGEKMFEGKEIWICTVCGFIYVGNNLPDRCPVCKVPNNKFQKIVGRVQI